MSNYALIKNSKIENIIVADENFLTYIENDYDEIINIDDLIVAPGPGWTAVDGIFIPPRMSGIPHDWIWYEQEGWWAPPLNNEEINS